METLCFTCGEPGHLVFHDGDGRIVNVCTACSLFIDQVVVNCQYLDTALQSAANQQEA